MLALIALLLASAPVPENNAPPPDVPRTVITLDPQVREALIQGLVSEVGAPFVITNLADAGASCDPQKLCVASDAIRTPGESDAAMAVRAHRLAAAGTPLTLAGAPAKTIVTLEKLYQGPSTTDETPLLLRVAVFTVAKAQTRIFYANIDWRIHRPDMQAWLPAGMLSDDLRRKFDVTDQ
jgi:hypothetical protein